MDPPKYSCVLLRASSEPPPPAVGKMLNSVGTVQKRRRKPCLFSQLEAALNIVSLWMHSLLHTYHKESAPELVVPQPDMLSSGSFSYIRLKSGFLGAVTQESSPCSILGCLVDALFSMIHSVAGWTISCHVADGGAVKLRVPLKNPWVFLTHLKSSRKRGESWKQFWWSLQACIRNGMFLQIAKNPLRNRLYHNQTCEWFFRQVDF